MEDEGSQLTNCQTNLAITIHALSLLFWHFINKPAYHWADMSLHLLLLKSSMNQALNIFQHRLMFNFSDLLILQNSGCPWRHAIDTPVCVAVLVADGDREPAVVGPNDLDRLGRFARDGHLLAFATVSRLVSCPVRTFTWKYKNNLIIKIFFY